MRLDEELMRALGEGWLSPEEAAGAIEMLLSDYPAEARERIYRSLFGGDRGKLAHSMPEPLAPEVSPPVLLRILDDLTRHGGLWTSTEESQREALRLFQLRRRGDVIVFARHGRIESPAFQFDEPDAPYFQEPRFSVRRPNQLLMAGQDPWGALDWWVAPNGRLDGRAPASLLDTDEEADLTSLAESITEPVG